MPRASRKPLEDRSLKELKRSELQALAKIYGIKANGKSPVIIKSLLANKAFVDSRREKNAESSKSSASVQFAPSTGPQPRRKSDRYRTPTPMPPRQRVVEDDIPELEATRDRVTPQESLGAMMDEEQVLVQDVVNKLRILNEETRSVLDEKFQGFKEMIWTRQILEHLCKDHRWDGSHGTDSESLQTVWRWYYSKEIDS